MAGKVIHVSDALHARVKYYCEDRALQMTAWVAYALEQAIAECVAPVPKRPLDESPVAVTDEDLLKRPPFWKGRK